MSSKQSSSSRLLYQISMYIILVWFQASDAMWVRATLVWAITQSRVVLLYRRFGTTYRSHLKDSRRGLLDPLKWERWDR
jgi:hypothetical protein